MIGHDAQTAAFKAAFSEGRPHHAWLLTGPQGLGKSLFAEAAAIWVLAGQPEVAGFAVDPETPAARFVRAGSHLDFKRLERTENPKTGKRRAEIVMGQIVRRDDTADTPLNELLQSRPALGDWRVVIVDATEDMNRNVANALLKNLEEPGPGTLFLLVSHAPGRLLPTIRSRCRTLRFARLTDTQVGRILDAQADDLSDDDRDALIRLAAGAPGRALRFADAGVASLERDLAALATADPETAPHRALALARGLAGKAAAARYDAFLDLAPAMLATAARRHDGPGRARAIAAWEEATRLAASAGPLALDPQAVAFDIARRLAAAGA
ncbi:hypothetical protein IP88_11260 [alpha proteobacterium AAP81b]|nr:hypothetical protein IP88_11260 [alpha proteobacterium AAP81b]